MTFVGTKVTLEKEGAIAIITINRPNALNALNETVLNELSQAIDDIRDDDSIKAVIITGAGEKAFVAGADITEIKDWDEKIGYLRSKKGQSIFNKIEELPKPVIAGINGFALGGGMELAMACDIRVANTNARLGQPEVKIGLIPGYGGTQRLARLVGEGMAKYLILTGEMISAQEAHRIGLVEHIVLPEELLSFCKKLANNLALLPPVAISYAKYVIHKGLDYPLEESLEIEAKHFGKICETEDKKEGINAFLEKRAPLFKGK